MSTFEGTDRVLDWPIIKRETGCFFMPSWTSMGPYGIEQVRDTIDGAFSWDAWSAGTQAKTEDSDRKWMKSLADKPYMMALSPWFYTNMPQWGKNWLWRGDDLWHDRWRQAIELQPEMLQVIAVMCGERCACIFD